MKQKVLNIIVTGFALVAFMAGAANTNNVQVSLYLSDQQQEELKFLKNYFGSASTLKNFSTNVTVAVVWSPDALAALQLRRDRVWQAIATNQDVNITKVENDLSLSPLTNVSFMFP